MVKEKQARAVVNDAQQGKQGKQAKKQRRRQIAKRLLLFMVIAAVSFCLFGLMYIL